jgi:hypothetical protein
MTTEVEALPTADGTNATYNVLPSSGTLRWPMLDDPAAGGDGDATNVSTPEDQETRYCRVIGDDISLPDGAVITAVRVKALCRTMQGFTSVWSGMNFLVRINGADYLQPSIFEVNSATYAEFYREMTVNPATSLAWTLAAINTMQWGFYAISGKEFIEGTWEWAYFLCTRCWLEVDYTVPAVGKPAGDGLTFWA